MISSRRRIGIGLAADDIDDGLERVAQRTGARDDDRHAFLPSVARDALIERVDHRRRALQYLEETATDEEQDAAQAALRIACAGVTKQGLELAISERAGRGAGINAVA